MALLLNTHALAWSIAIDFIIIAIFYIKDGVKVSGSLLLPLFELPCVSNVLFIAIAIIK